jgi:hypothetical protein
VTTHRTHKRQISLPSAELESEIYTLDRAATEFGLLLYRKKCVAPDSLLISYGVRSAGKACDGWTDKRTLCSILWDYDFGVLHFMFT